MASLRQLPLEAASYITRLFGHTTALRSLSTLGNNLSSNFYTHPSKSSTRSYHLPSTFSPSLSPTFSTNSPSSQPPPTQSFLPVPFITETLSGLTHTTDLFSRLLKERIIALYGPIDDRLAATVTASLLYLESSDPSAPISLYINSPGGSVTSGLAIYDTMQYITPEVHTICLGQAASMGSLLLVGGAQGKRYILEHASVMLHQPSGGYAGTAQDIAIHAKEILRVRELLNRIYQRHLSPKTWVAEGDDQSKSATGGVGTSSTGSAERAATSTSSSASASTTTAPDGIGGTAKGQGKGKWIPSPTNQRKTLDEIEKMMERDYFLSAKEALELGIVDEIMGSRKIASQGESRG